MTDAGRVEEGIDRVREALVLLRGLGTDTPSIFGLVLAHCLRSAGRHAEALAAVEDVLLAVERTGERLWEAEANRLKADLLLAANEGLPSAEADAEACLHHALEIARRQDAKSLELRAAMSLGRLLRRRGQREEARQTLDERYRWFTEGFDTRDLRKAEALLVELS